MAEILVSKLSNIIAKEVDIIRGVEDQVGIMEWDLRMMYALLQDVEALGGPRDYLQHLYELIENANLNADNAIEKFITSAANRTIFQHMIDRYTVSRQLKCIKSSITISMLKEMAANAGDQINSDNPFQHFITSLTSDSPRLFFRQLIEINEALTLRHTISFEHSAARTILRDIWGVLRTLFLGDQDHWRLTYDRVFSIQSYLNFLYPFLEPVNGLGEREKIWVLQMKDIADSVKAVGDVAMKHLQERKNVVKSMISRSKVVEEIEEIERKTAYLCRIMRIYDVGVYQEKQLSIGGEASSSSSSIAQEEKPNHDMENGTFSSLQKKFANWFHQTTTGIYVEDLVKELEIEVKLMHASLVDFQENPSKRLKVWLEQIRGIANDAQKAIDAYRKSRPGDLLYIDITNDIRRITNRLDDISERMDASNSIFHSLCHRPPANIFGFPDDVRAVKKQLLHGENKCCIVLIMGEGGIGKTTFAKITYSDNDVRDHFPFRAWISIPRDNDIAVVREIRKQFMISPRLKGIEKPLFDDRYLIVLDSSITAEARVLDDVRIAFPDKFNGSRIMITSRGMPIGLNDHSSVYCHRVQKLNDEDIEKLFATVTYKPYMELPRNLRKCLHYFRMFPDDFAIPSRRLLTLWVAEGFVNKRMGDEPAELIAKRYLNELIDRNLVEVVKRKFDGDVKKCRLSEAGDKILEDYDKDASSGSSSTHRFADHCNDTDFCYQQIHGNDNSTPLKPLYKDVLSFLSFDHRGGSKPGEDIEKFLQRCISSKCFLLLRVLDLERVFRPKFPKVVGKLRQLRYLGLRWTYLEELPEFVRSLLKLQTLDLKHTYICTLPHSIWKMQRLRHLYLIEIYRSRFKSKPLSSSLMELQTLWGAFVDEESPVKNGLDTIKNLRELGLACRIILSRKKMLSQIDAVADWILTLEHLESLRLRSFDEQGKAWYLPVKNLSKLGNLSSIYLLGRLNLEFVKCGIPKVMRQQP